MPKRLTEPDEVADPVRARLQRDQASRMASLAGRAAAPSAAQPRIQPPLQPEVALRHPPEPESELDPEPQRTVAPVRKRQPVAVLDHQHATVIRKTRLTPSEAKANEEVLALLRRITDSRLSESAVTRVLWSLLREAEAELKQLARRGVSLRRPANGPSLEMATYERDLGQLFLDALKSLGR